MMAQNPNAERPAAAPVSSWSARSGDGLTARQLDGFACVGCGTEQRPGLAFIPAGYVAGSGQLFRCADGCPEDADDPRSAPEVVEVAVETAPEVDIVAAPGVDQVTDRREGCTQAFGYRQAFAWCVMRHSDEDRPDERDHYGEDLTVDLSLAAGERANNGTFLPLRMSAFLRQHDRNAEPSIELGHEGKNGIELTLDEAEQVAAHLVRLVVVAREAQARP
ncbi:hypothetical protein LO772_19365 [Yinghuangia sp. ASG 101]|uniref:DUF6907 domain-containing protein n=1 Tax=Yinghuangia sp. ASG 101 TaxID=2896848 RepID=UPI001E2D1BCF|nr:hypothetical protein [Yinghuangia sp. ASG 101]UGQ09118.1 hypothetical protein LO772_19365 [Yinghuangia sp. ASG 101]